jgi:hypothetical protein
MEILEKQDPEKKRLMDEAKRHKDNLSNDIHFVSEKTEKMLINAVIIGGALALTYVLVRQLSGGKSKKKKSKTVKLVTQAPEQGAGEQEEEDGGGNSILAEIGTKIANEATMFLLNLAKEKLMEYLQSGKEKQNENH